jgi:hypothetical protein
MIAAICGCCSPKLQAFYGSLSDSTSKQDVALFAEMLSLPNSRSGLTMPLCVASPCSFARRVVMQYPNQLGVVTSGRGRQCDGASSLGQ